MTDSLEQFKNEEEEGEEEENLELGIENKKKRGEIKKNCDIKKQRE